MTDDLDEGFYAPDFSPHREIIRTCDRIVRLLQTIADQNGSTTP